MNQTLGTNLFISGYCVRGHFSPQEIEARLIHLIEQIKMETGGMPADVRIYPLNDKGGVGSTVFQPLTDSASMGLAPGGAMIGDTWHDHDHTFFLIASCKTYDFRAVGDWLNSHVGDVISSGKFNLSANCVFELPQTQTKKLLRACN